MIWAFFAWQIYLDFSAYSDIAIGSARMIGFRLTKNFNRPMVSVGQHEFWKRWHITLTRWFREYLYTPIRRKSNRRWWPVFSIYMVFLATGIWHGASWNFIFWGVWCGFGVVLLEPLIIKYVFNMKTTSGKFLLWVFTTLFMYTGLVWFRAPDWHTAMEVLASLFRGFDSWDAADWGLTTGELRLAWMSFVFIFLVEAAIDLKPQLETAFYEGPGLKRWAVAWLLFIGLILMGSYGVNIQDEAFIYFQF
jgi:D-alanyl-lipoteichoic acid acyltransferase DltB (MBOAT superfamily)